MADELTRALVERGLFELLRHRLIRSVSVASPAAGAEWTQAVPAGVSWELLLVRHTLTTSAVVATRFPGVALLDFDGNVATVFPPQAGQAASIAAAHLFIAGLGYSVATAGPVAGMATPPFPVPGGMSLKSSTPGLDAGDQYTAVRLLVREWSAQQVVAQVQWIGRQLPTYDLLDLGV